MAPTLVALAAGVGSRYGGLKQLEPVGPNGETLLEYSIYDAMQAGFSRVVLVVSSETESLFREAFAGGMAGRVAISYVHQSVEDLPAALQRVPGRVKPWGTGQAVLAAEPEVLGAFAVINADDFYGAESYQALGRFLSESHDGETWRFSMVGFQLGQTLSASGSVSRALCRLDADRRLERIVEVLEVWKHERGGAYTDAAGERIIVSGDQIVSMNMWGFTPALFPELRCRFIEFLGQYGQVEGSEFLVPEVVQDLVHTGRAQVDVLNHAGRWCGITYPEDKERVAGIIASLVMDGEYPERLWA